MRLLYPPKSKTILAVLAATMLVVALSASTALAGRQAAVSPQEAESMARLDGASIVLNNLCAELDGDVAVYGSGWASREMILLSLVMSADDPVLWFAGSVNEAGAFEVTKTLKTKVSRGVSVKVKYPGAGLFTLEALGTTGRLATAPIIVAEDKCNAAEETSS